MLRVARRTTAAVIASAAAATTPHLPSAGSSSSSLFHVACGAGNGVARLSPSLRHQSSSSSAGMGENISKKEEKAKTAEKDMNEKEEEVEEEEENAVYILKSAYTREAEERATGQTSASAALHAKSETSASWGMNVADESINHSGETNGDARLKENKQRCWGNNVLGYSIDTLTMNSIGGPLGGAARIVNTQKNLNKKLRLKHKAAETLPHFDVCVIGAGPAGVAAALRAIDYDKKVCLIEKHRIGGADLWNGALQSKTLWEMSKFIANVKSGSAYRIFNTNALAGQVQLNEDKMRKSLLSASEFRERQLLHAIEAADVKLIQGSAMFASPTEVNVHNNETGEYNTVTADYFIIATGSAPREHPHFPTNGTSIVTSDEIMAQPLPKSIVIVGAGVIGCEFASIYANLGKCKVHIIDKAPRILPMEDEDIALYVQSLLESKGVSVHHEASLFDLQAFEDDDQTTGVQYMIKNNKTKKMESFSVERALISIGRLPNYKGLGLENTRCRVTDGRMKVDAFQRCVPHQNIYAVGDATMDIALVNMGETEGKLAIDHIYSTKKEHSPIIDNLSTIMFLDEEVAAVGLNEQQCRQQQIGYMMARYGYEFVSRAVAMGDTKGFIKIIVTNDREKRVLGVRAVGPHASSVVELASLAIHNRQSAYELAELMTAYPAITQGFQECLRMLLGRSILKPNVFPQLILRTWEPPAFARGRFYQEQDAKKLPTAESDGVHRTAAPPPPIPCLEPLVGKAPTA